jgi:hypothetical protein
MIDSDKEPQVLGQGRERESMLIKLMISNIGIAKSELYLYNHVTPHEISSQWAVTGTKVITSSVLRCLQPVTEPMVIIVQYAYFHAVSA